MAKGRTDAQNVESPNPPPEGLLLARAADRGRDGRPAAAAAASSKTAARDSVLVPRVPGRGLPRPGFRDSLLPALDNPRLTQIRFVLDPVADGMPQLWSQLHDTAHPERRSAASASWRSRWPPTAGAVLRSGDPTHRNELDLRQPVVQQGPSFKIFVGAEDEKQSWRTG